MHRRDGRGEGDQQPKSQQTGLLQWENEDYYPDSESYDKTSFESYIAICVAAKDDGPSLVEWVDYHLCIGAGRIYLYDDRSSPPMLPYVESYVAAGTVVYQYIDIGTRGDGRVAEPRADTWTGGMADLIVL